MAFDLDQSRLFFRVEVNPVVGFGHFMRCLALARFLGKDYACCFAMGHVTPEVSNALERYDIGTIAVRPQDQYHPDAAAGASELPFDLEGLIKQTDVVILDGYRFGQEYRRRLGESGAKVVQFFDGVDFEANVDGYITPLILSDQERMRLEMRCQVFDGSDGFLIRPEFYVQQHQTVALKGTTFIYATQDASMAYYKKAKKLADTKVVALTNQRYVGACRQMGWDVLMNADAMEVDIAMSKCDAALLPASSVALEYLVVHSRAPYVFVTAENQREGYNRMLRAGYWLDAERILDEVGEPERSNLGMVNPEIGLRNWMADL